MALRRIVALLGVLLILVGLSQLAWAGWWTGAVRSIYDAPLLLRLLGVVGIVFGAILITAAAKRIVGLRALMYVVGVYSALTGLLVLASPSFGEDLVYAMMLGRSHAFRVLVIWIAGVIRIALGVALLYALRRPGHLETAA